MAYPYLSPEVQSWLDQEDNLPFADYFTGLATGKKDLEWRQVSIEIAARWCMLREAGLDGKALHPQLSAVIEPPALKYFKNYGSNPVDYLWQLMCGHAAAYRLAAIDEFELTKALYGIYRSLLPEKKSVDPFDGMIRVKLASIFPSENGTITYGIRNDGLHSEIIVNPPADAVGWNEYADQFRKLMLG